MMNKTVKPVLIGTATGAALGLVGDITVGGVGVAALGTAVALPPLLIVGGVIGLGFGMAYAFGRKSQGAQI